MTQALHVTNVSLSLCEFCIELCFREFVKVLNITALYLNTAQESLHLQFKIKDFSNAHQKCHLHLFSVHELSYFVLFGKQ